MSKLLFLGTSACDFSPRLKTDLKDKFDKDARRSSAAIYGGRYLFDCGIHTPESLGIAGCELGKITDIFITHLHVDHYVEENIAAVAAGAGGVRLWVREDAKQIDLPGVTVMRMKPFVTYEVDGSTTVTGLPANHDPRYAPQHILLTADGKKIYYGTDGAWMLHDSFKYLTDAALDACILDCTSGDYNGDFRMGEHNSIPMIRLMLPSLRTIGAINDGTRLIVTHMAPSLHVSHAETEKIMEPIQLLMQRGQLALRGTHREIILHG